MISSLVEEKDFVCLVSFSFTLTSDFFCPRTFLSAKQFSSRVLWREFQLACGTQNVKKRQNKTAHFFDRSWWSLFSCDNVGEKPMVNTFSILNWVNTRRKKNINIQNERMNFLGVMLNYADIQTELVGVISKLSALAFKQLLKNVNCTS